LGQEIYSLDRSIEERRERVKDADIEENISSRLETLEYILQALKGAEESLDALRSGLELRLISATDEAQEAQIKEIQ